MKAQPKAVPAKRNWYLIFIAVAAIVVAVAYLSRDNGDSSSDANSKALEPITATAAQKLASLDALSVTRLPENDVRVLKTDTLLNILAASYKESPEAIANATYVAHQQLKRMGKEATNVAILEHMAMAPPASAGYKQAVMAYIADIGK